MESAPQPHLLEGAERGHLRGADATARKAAGCTVKRTGIVLSKARQTWLSLRARLPLAALHPSADSTLTPASRRFRLSDSPSQTNEKMSQTASF
jgi:hypothetical protein